MDRLCRRESGGVGQIVTPSLIMGGRLGGGWADPVGELVTPPLIIIPSRVRSLKVLRWSLTVLGL